MKHNVLLSYVICLIMTFLLGLLLTVLCGCSQEYKQHATYARYEEHPALILYDITVTPEIVEEVAQEIEYEEELYEEPFTDEHPHEELIVWGTEYENLDEVYPQPEEYAQENYENMEFASYEEWTGAVASAYSIWCNGGTETASGIPLDDYTPTVASRWLPLWSYIEVMYGDTTVVCQVTDRGPYIDGRDLDLSLGAVQALGFDSTDEWGVREVAYRLL